MNDLVAIDQKALDMRVWINTVPYKRAQLNKKVHSKACSLM